MRLLTRALWAFIFFTLFAFALNNKQATVVYGFFGTQWRAPMVIVVLVAFGLGAALGVAAMVPGWWKHWRVARRFAPTAPEKTASPADVNATTTPAEPVIQAPPREGL